MNDRMKDLIGQTLGQYKIVEQIGQGGMATVFKAYQPGLNRDVALKILPPYVAEKEGFTERFSREAQAIGNLHHANILPVYDFGQDKGYGYIAMRYIPNAKTLADIMVEPVSTEQLIEITKQIAGALDHAHNTGIIHRDIKPTNILMDGDWIQLSDFGLAKMVEDPSELTGTGIGLGTPAYMSPEQAKGDKIDRRTDIYALGIIVYEILTGQVPHKAETPLATVVKRINEPLPPPRSINPNIPETVEKTLLRALAKNPDHRFDSAGAFSDSLKRGFEAQPLNKAEMTMPAPVKHVDIPPAAEQPQSIPVPVSSVSTPAVAPLRRSNSPGAMEIVTMTILGLFGLCGLSGSFLFLIPNDAGELDFFMTPAFLGLLFASVTSILMIWIRDRSRPASALYALGVLSWFIGINIIGWGGTFTLQPDEGAFLENLGFSLALCFAPGMFFTMLGMLFYGIDFRWGQQAKAAVKAQAAVAAAPMAKSQVPLPKTDKYTDKLERAENYKKQIIILIGQKKGSAFANQLNLLGDQLNQWETHMQQLVKRVRDFEADEIIQRDLRDVPTDIERLQAQLNSETNPQVRKEMGETLNSYQQQQQQLNALVTLMRRTELDIDETLAAIGGIYSQMQLIGAKDVSGNRARRLSADVDEQAQRLGDLLDAMDEVYDSSASLEWRLETKSPLGIGR